ncbi:hypothetical protein AMTR_s00328p00003340 [Amborella trichopoda]|uniref:Uncharacterized protein n=1 Tax=Amborella trichopoda TaxID=13333 RepID=W1NRZ8_AMBTC|nr:hypothetical protein AMTR_s00328p00003340 [Amborella trichopoda]
MALGHYSAYRLAQALALALAFNKVRGQPYHSPDPSPASPGVRPWWPGPPAIIYGQGFFGTTGQPIVSSGT